MGETAEPVEAEGRLRRRALRLEYATIGWNVGEAVFTIGLGIAAGSLALVGFGVDAVVEVFASLVVVWSLRPHHDAGRAARARRSLRLTGAAFFALAAVLGVAAGSDLLTGRRAEESPLGIVYLAVTALVMFGLAGLKRRTAVSFDSAPLRSEAAMTFLDGILSTATLTGLALNAFAGWWWADPLAALVVAVAAVNEGREAWEEASEL